MINDPNGMLISAAPVDPMQQGTSVPVQQGTSVPVQQGTPAPMQQGSADPVQQGTPAPMQQGSAAPQGEQNQMQFDEPFPYVRRDYKNNPLNKQDEVELSKFKYTAAQLIHNPKVTDMIIKRLESNSNHPYKSIADLSLNIMYRMESEAHKNKKPWDDVVKLTGGIDIVKQITEIASVIGKVRKDMPQKDFTLIFGETVQQYYKSKLASGEITKAQAAEDAYVVGQLQAQLKGEDVSETTKRLQTTNQLQQQGINFSNSTVDNGQFKTPEPVDNPMNPPTTMKEVLDTGKGGLLNG